MLDPVALDYIEIITPYLKYVRSWRLHFCIIPRRCLFTNKVLWMTLCYKNDQYDKFYIDKNEFILWSLKK